MTQSNSQAMPKANIVMSLIGAAGVILAALIGYGASTRPVELAIDATRTAEAREIATQQASAALIAGTYTPQAAVVTGIPVTATPWPTSAPATSTAAAGPTGTPAPALASKTLQPTPKPSFSDIRFCLEGDLDKQARRCRVALTTFSDPTQRVYVSWSYANLYAGMKFSVKWYLKDQLLEIPNSLPDTWDGRVLTLDGTSVYTWLDASGVKAFKKDRFPEGSYKVDLFIGNHPEATGRFAVN